MNVVVSPKRIATFLTCVVFSIAVAGVAAECVHKATKSWPHKGVAVLAGKFVLDTELSLPAWYSSIAILACAGVLALIAAHAHRVRSPVAWHWTGLALIFGLMSFDEMSAMHEMFIVPLRRYFGARGIFHYAWVIPGLAFVAAFGIAYLRFVFFHLDRRTRWRFIISGVVYVGAALGVELAEGPIDEHFGVGSAPARIAVTIEETLEMLGIVYFLYSLLCYVAEHVGEIRVTIEPSAGETPRQRQDASRRQSRLATDLEDTTAIWNEMPQSREELAGAIADVK